MEADATTSTGPEPPSYRTPEWIEPPSNVVPATVALDLVLARREILAVWISDALVYPTGVTFGLNVKRRSGPDTTPPFFGASSEEELQLGLLLADGRKVIVHRLGDLKPFLARPDRPILRPRSGGGAPHVASTQMWLWPLPPPGPITFYFAWPREGIEETSIRIDAGAIRDAASRAIELWKDVRPLPPTEDDVTV